MYERRLVFSKDMNKEEVMKNLQELERINHQLTRNIMLLENNIGIDVDGEEISKNPVLEKVMEIIEDNESNEKEMNIKICEYLSLIIKNMTGEELSQHLSMLGFNKQNLNVVVRLEL